MRRRAKSGAHSCGRPPKSNAAVDVRDVLEFDVDGLVAPHVETADQTAARVRMAEGAATIVILETRLGIKNAASIAEVAGLDGIVGGPSDLSHDSESGPD